MLRTLVAILAITCVSTSVSADDLSDQIKARVRARLKEKLNVSGPRTITNNNVINGNDNAAMNTADGSQNLTVKYREGDITYTDSRQWHDSHDQTTTTTTTDSRQWHRREGDTTSTYAPRYREGDRTETYAPRYTPVRTEGYYAPRVIPTETYIPPARLTYSRIEDCTTTIAIRCWAPCGGYFIDSEGRRFNLLDTYSKVASEHRYATLPGRYWRSSGGNLFYTAAWGTSVRTFQYAGL